MVDTTPSARIIPPRKGPERWLERAGPMMIPLLTAVGYVIGYGVMSLVARGLDVSVRDLGLSLPDYLLLIAANYIFLTVALAVVLWPMFVVPRLKEKGWRFPKSHWATALWLVLLVVGILLKVRDARPLWVWAALGTSMFMYSLSEALTRKPGRPSLSSIRWSIVGVLAVLAFVTIVLVGDAWPREVRAYAQNDGSRAPTFWLTPSQALQPHKGVAVWSGGEACVVRVGSNVLIAKHGTLVVKELDQFLPMNCKVIAKFVVAPLMPTPTASTTTTTTSTTTTSTTTTSTTTTSTSTTPKH